MPALPSSWSGTGSKWIRCWDVAASKQGAIPFFITA
jgi:hypothetical protein